MRAGDDCVVRIRQRDCSYAERPGFVLRRFTEQGQQWVTVSHTDRRGGVEMYLATYVSS